MNHTGTVPFETERLICRRFNEGDIKAALNNWASLPEVQFEYGEPVYETEEQVRDLIESYISNYRRDDYYRWAIVSKENGECIGQIALCRVYSDSRTAEIEYCIGKAFWGNGYAGEALEGLIDCIFTHTDFHKLEAYHRNANSRSGRVLEKSGMHVTENVERFMRLNKLPHDETCYMITKTIYQNNMYRGSLCRT